MIFRILLSIFFFSTLLTTSPFAANNDIARTMAQPRPQDESTGEPPYEMVWAKRIPEHPPLINFDSLQGWTVEDRNGGSGELYESRKQRLWDSNVARLVYRGNSIESSVTLIPPQPVEIPVPVSAATLWIYGNNWGWVPDPSTPRVDVTLLIQNKNGERLRLPITNVNWKEWWMAHKIIPPEWMEQTPLSVTGIEIKGCANTEDRELYFEDLAFFQETPQPLTFQPRPQRGVDPFPGQSPGANTGPGRLPFPTREETILPDNDTNEFSTRTIHPAPLGDDYILRYDGTDAIVEYDLTSTQPFFRTIAVKLNGQQIGNVWVDAGPEFISELQDVHCERIEPSLTESATIHGKWTGQCQGQPVRVEMTIRLWQKSLVIDTFCTGGLAKELRYGCITSVEKPELLKLPFLNYGGHHLNVLMSKGEHPFFASVWMDWYRSNASEPYAIDKIEDDRVQLNGGVHYHPKTNGARNDLFERVFITVSPMFEEVLPTIDNPPAKEGKIAGQRLWQENWGPSDYAKEHERSQDLRAYGIKMLTQCNHEITWRNEGESFTFRTQSAPGKGGDEALKKYIADQQALGWREGLYTNYCDFAPVNAFWNIDAVMRRTNNELVTSWPRCYSPKALFAVEMDEKLAPEIHKKFHTNAAYTDVHTSVSPWDRCDYDARVPGAGTFAATYYAYGELLLHDQDVYDHHDWSEGNHQWLYAGLTTGNYGLTYGGLPLWQYPYLPHFDLLKMHPLSVDIGIPWTGQFFSGKEGWDKPENIDHSIDQFIAATIAYGHMGWLVEETHGIRRTCRSYYMLQPLQSRYIQEKPRSILYGTGDQLISSTEAFLHDTWKENCLFIEYENGLQVWINGNETKDWNIQYKDNPYTLPPYGWLAAQGNDFLTASYHIDGQRCDRMSAPESIFLDGRGTSRCFDGIETAGCVAVCKSEQTPGISLIAVDGVDKLTIRTPERQYGKEDIRTVIANIADVEAIQMMAYDSHGTPVNENPIVLKKENNPDGWTIPMQKNAIRYEIQIQ